MTITVDNISYEILEEFSVLHLGWECDYKGYLVDKNGKPKLVLTDHGRAYFAKNKELEEKIKEYQELTSTYKKILKRVYNQK